MTSQHERHGSGVSTGRSVAQPSSRARAAAMKCLLASRAAETYLLAGTEKIGAASPFAVLPLAEASDIITDVPADDPELRRMVTAGVKEFACRETRGTVDDV
ncbi:hypothetical protein ACQPZX_35375 [Actinoplanes sp. CA-142083]|uniref:hypothetical protein n=1 Tax=Actinoplanes sp. CA-142083 TaxID=3239903 RepID=UPI003D923FC5